ncbi:PAS-domain containing protein [Palleronia rufa]|uniref:PAS-domain containing protein n=1 Tax=Palleronia rufa TaxID=1530186 RepID=UPI00068C2C51|nr:PAS-domain containing protein [Palleronia rufa]
MDALMLGLVPGLVSVSAGLAAAAWLMRPLGRVRLIGEPLPATTFVLDEGAILDATEPAREILDRLGQDGRSADRLVQWLSDRFPELPRALSFLAERGDRTLAARDGIGRLSLRLDGDRIRLTLSEDPHLRVELDRACHEAAQQELDSLRRMGDSMPHAIWRQDETGRINWVNNAYLEQLRTVTRAEPTWPPAPLFLDLDLAAGETRRVQLDQNWFDCTAVQMEGGLMVSAVPADALVAAETSLATFKSTMSHTFAHLTVGLAIFDRHRRLTIFNPALTDLTRLPIDMLIARPTVESFLDALRSRQMIPEPRDYASWRDKVMDVERTAQNGTYCELWHLPGSHTYRITGRPQPDGAFALLMEDISAEIGLTRRFRSEIETGRATLDALPDAVAVFDTAGTLTLTNGAYDLLWGVETADSVSQLSLRDALESWRSRCEPDPIWADMATRLGSNGVNPDGLDLRLDDGRRISLCATTLRTGALLVRFRAQEAKVSALMPTRAHQLIETRLKA